MKKQFLHIFSLLTLILLWSSCRNDFETTPSTGTLEFSKDTVFLDTVFNNIGSSTYTLKVYNRSDNVINIPSIQLAQGESSNYRLNVDGMAGKQFTNVEILANDSIFVFIETTIDITEFTTSNFNFLYTDAITFDEGVNQQQVELVTLVQDAVFLYPQRDSNGIKETLNLGTNEEGEDVLIEGFLLEDDELHFTADKPYVIYGYAAVPPNESLIIDAGARIHFHEASGLLVANQARLEANGMPSTDQNIQEGEVIFESDRLEPEFSDISGQWGAIWFTQGSTGEFNHTTIKNATVGLLADTGNTSDSPLIINNTQIYNSSNIGLYALNSNISGQNIVVNNAGISAVWLRLGGRYDFTHCTFSNYLSGFRNFPALQIDNFLLTEEQLFVADLQEANFINCAIYGNQREEISFTKSDDALFSFKFTNSLIRFQDDLGQFTEDPLYDFDNIMFFKNVLLNQDPLFKNPETNDFRIPEESPLNGQASNQGVLIAPFDLLNQSRTNPADIGAYESIVFDEDED